MSNTGCGRAGTQEENLLIFQLLFQNTHRREHTGQNNRSSTLNIIIEAGDFVFVLIQQVIELNHNIGPAFSDSINKFSNQGIVFRSGDAFLTKTHVKRVVQKFFIIRTDVDADRQSLLGVNTGASSVESKFSDRDAHAVDTQVA